jgi:hypothetical protein
MCFPGARYANLSADQMSMLKDFEIAFKNKFDQEIFCLAIDKESKRQIETT